MKFTNKDVLLFDLDGTLIDSVPDLALSINQMLDALGMTPYPTDTIRSWVGNGAAVLTQRALSGSIDINPDLDATFVEEALSIFLTYYEQNVCVETTLYPNVKSTLKSLHNHGYRLVIVTNKPEQFVRPILKHLGLNDFFEMVVGGDSLPKRKPDPMQLTYVCDKLGVTPSSCLMIGDSKNDIFAATAAGMQSIGLTYGYNHGEDINSHGATLVLDDFANIIETLASLTAPAE
ncbi:phosphoglycolate phosphatase [Pseudoalteromonas luteoviolacea]|uniref:Phosphoglycolate phosphatase n=1 Tax=Pseudoalteromonas luteoviolacea TaxID=43657 RepID=A0A0C1MPS7_9GAMM|nr:phosphoglycolate phosphatase [Pseudoalteromonas luteoviolacea]KID56598.1 phosphoglycolate phosphatase [Pseudoalteromonas luteoviolacea]